VGNCGSSQTGRNLLGFLSAIELSKAHPSIAILQRLAAAYNTTVLKFFDVSRHSRRLIRPVSDACSGPSRDHGAAFYLTKMLECRLFRIPPNAGSGGAYSHAGEEFIHMLEGSFELWLDELECHVKLSWRQFVV
jgi:transcriptional regulator with XRE-family HTH domain